MTSTQQMLDERYGRGLTRGARRLWLIVGGVVIVLAVAIAGWFAVSSSQGAVDATTTGFEVVDEHTVTVTFQMTAPAGSEIACVLEAQDEEHGVVGWRVVRYPASVDHTRAQTEEVPTIGPAVTGLVNSCWVP
jgi:hypothetical protein